MTSCKKDELEIATTGSVAISYTPALNSDLPDSYYCRLYVFEDYPNKPALQSQYIGVGTFVNGKTRMTFDNLNSGNYIITFYNNRVLVTNTVQVTAGKTNHYDF